MTKKEALPERNDAQGLLVERGEIPLKMTEDLTSSKIAKTAWNLIVFDLDGVITSEAAYWDAAGLTLHELLYSPQYWGLDKSHLGVEGLYHPAATAEESRYISRTLLSESEILALKTRAINSDWDICYAAVCLQLIDLLALLPGLSSLLPLKPWDTDWLAAFRQQISSVKGQKRRRALPGIPLHPQGAVGIKFFDSPLFRDYIGLELINRFDFYASQVLDHPIKNVFSRYSPLWTFCRDIFQEWYLGDDLYTQTYGHAPAQLGKPGCIYFEQPLLSLEEVSTTLELLCQQGYVLGIATGRPHQEALVPLAKQRLLQYFDQQHISTYDDVERAEAKLRANGDQALLNKPHPYLFFLAADHNYDATESQSKAPYLESFVVVGDSTSDILGGRAAGALTVAVLTGARTTEARTLLVQSGPDFIVDDMTKLPALLAVLAT